MMKPNGKGFHKKENQKESESSTSETNSEHPDKKRTIIQCDFSTGGHVVDENVERLAEVSLLFSLKSKVQCLVHRVAWYEANVVSISRQVMINFQPRVNSKWRDAELLKLFLKELHEPRQETSWNSDVANLSTSSSSAEGKGAETVTEPSLCIDKA